MSGSVISLFVLLRLAQSTGLGAVWWSYVNRTTNPNDGFFSALDASTLANAAEAVDAAQVVFFLLLSFFIGEVFCTYGRWLRAALFDQKENAIETASQHARSELVGFEYQWVVLKLLMLDGATIAGIAYTLVLYEGYGDRSLADLGWLALNAVIFSAFCLFTARRVGSSIEANESQQDT